ncbi:MAG: hypothetical protein H0W01_02245 [Pseudonocardiales bacterium]|nr:hypothetical protein [Pseudonocardiales bacterium]
MKYILMMFGDQASMMETRSVEWIKEMIEFMGTVNDDLTNAGELVSAEGLADASQAKTVRYDGGIAVPSDGPFAESKESLAGYWIVDVESEKRALEIATHIVDFTHGPLEVRQIADAPPEY